MEWFKKNWFKIGILVIFGSAVLLYFLVPALNTEENLTPQNKKIVSPVQYRKLDDECKKYGYENWDPMLNFTSEDFSVSKKYQYSIPLNTCVSVWESSSREGGEIIIYKEIRDIYLDKLIFLFDSECESNYRYIYKGILSDEEFTESLIEKCPTTIGAFQNKKDEIFER